MINYDRVASKAFSVLKGHGFPVVMYDITGNETVDPEQGRRFYVATPNMMLTVDEENQEMSLSKNSTVELSQYEKVLVQLRQLASHYMLNFTLRNYGKDIKPRDFSYQAKNAKESTMNEGKFKDLKKKAYYTQVGDDVSTDSISESSLSRLTGSKKTSYQTLENVRILIKHKQPVSEETRGARTRNIHSIFLEMNGERFKFPHNHLGGARAMARHLERGGSMADTVAENIIESVGNYVKLREFMRYVQSNKLITEESDDIVKLVKENMQSLADNLRKLSGSKSYGVARARIEEQHREEIEEEEISKLRDMFTVKKFNEKMDDVLPIVGQMVKEKDNYMKRIEEAVSKPVYMETSTFVTEMPIEYESAHAKLGNKLRDMATRIEENRELSQYIDGIAGKIIQEQELTSFESSVLSSFFENAQIKKPGTATKGIEQDVMESFETKLRSYELCFE